MITWSRQSESLTCYCASFFRCISALEALKLEAKDEQLGVDIVMRALRTPCATIAKNAGVDPSVVVQKVMAGDSPSMGYDALHDRYVDMIQEGEYLCQEL